MNYKILSFDEIDSTNSEAIRLAKTNTKKKYAIIAKTQTKGRGRSGKNWQSPIGNLYTSLLLPIDQELEVLSQLSFVAGLAVYDSIVFIVNSASFAYNYSRNDIIDYIKLKWPNDILINNKKISGILLESLAVKSNNYLIVGAGINITSHPLNIDQACTSLIAENITTLQAEKLLEIFIANFEKYYQIWEKEGFNPIKKIWLKRAYKLYELVTINDGNTTIVGIFKDIDELGRIRIELPSKKIISYANASLK